MSAPPQYAPADGQYPPADKSQVHMQPPMPQPPQMAMPNPGIAAQMGEQYRAQLFAQCAQGVHDRETKYGMFGIIMAVLCFPCGLICLFSDKQDRCARCGVRLN
ncbi:hypothetical protein BT96DRAFT_913151 [Gymnopus androsaceus JB14]|uniref:Uncharacterized protein n=1 Tax=Gymnopus androsaceus JB14 TaxID=1447944 RepID=A0A6A4IL97_9AGAR|nr:hypothetical protein BT96DRAFT_913151 [Gymnopus androsaceus JB14]